MLAVQGQAECQPSVSAQTSLRAHGYFRPASAFLLHTSLDGIQ